MVALTLPFTGRSAELRFALDLVAADGSIVVAGAAGVGKSRLLADVADQAHAAGRIIDRATATASARGIPFGAFAHLVPAASLDKKLDGVLATMIDALAQGSDGRPRLVCVDDAHLLDDASATLVHLLAQQRGVAIVVAVRTGEPCPDPVTALWKDGDANRLDLQPLSEHEVGELVAKALDGPLDTATLRMLFSSTRGNVLFLREMLRAGLEAGALHNSDGLWRWRGHPRLASTVQELVNLRLDRLSRRDRSGLEVMALGEPLPLAVLTGLVDAATVDRLERQGLIEIADAGGRRVARVSHPLFGEAIRDSLPRLSSDDLQTRIADAFEHSAELTADDLLRVATLRLDSGGAADPQVLLAAARRAWSLADVALTERLAAAALVTGPEPEARYLLGEVDVYRGQYERAVEGWRALLAEDLPDPLRGRIAKAAANVLGFTRNRAAEAEELLVQAESKIDSDDIRQRLASVRVGLFVHRMPGQEVRRFTEPLLQAPDVSDEAKVWAWVASARDRMAAGQLTSVISESESIAASASRARDDWPLALLFVSMCRFYCHLLSARLNEAEDLARQHLDASLTDHISMPRGVWSAAIGLVLLSRGHLEAALVQYQEAVVVLRKDDSGVLQPVLTELAMVFGLRGEVEAAKATLEEANRSHQGMITSLFPPARSQAAVLAAQGRMTAARQVLADYVAKSRAVDQPLFELGGLHDQVRYGGAVEAAERLVEIAATFEGPVPQAYAHQAIAIATDDGRLLVEAAARFDAIGLVLDAAETYTVAANALRAEGQNASATAATGQAEERKNKCAPARTPLLALAREDVATLSGREREVAGLAAAGRTDAQIAEELFISVRTVNAHLRSVYDKLGVRSRHDLAEAMGSAAQPGSKGPRQK